VSNLAPRQDNDLFAQLANDWRANGRDWTRPGFRTMAVYRFGVWRMGVRPKLLRAPLSLLYRWLFRHHRRDAKARRYRKRPAQSRPLLAAIYGLIITDTLVVDHGSQR